MKKDLIEDIIKNYILIKENKNGISPLILGWIKRFFPNTKDESDVSWCSIGLINAFKEFLNIDVTLYKVTPAAKSWVNYGKKLLDNSKAEYGDLIIFNRGTSWQGHIAIFLRYNKVNGNPIVLGFNQSDALTIEEMDKSKIFQINTW